MPHIARTGLAKHLVMPENRVRVIAPDMGGGFGAKCVLYQEEVAVCAASRLLHRPVKWVSDRSEDLHATMHGREQRHHIRVAATAEGRVLGVRSEIAAANGAYAPWPYTAALDSGQASENVTGPYDIPDYGRDVAAVVTNKAPMGPYRGVGRVIACLGIERAMDDLAERLGLDALEVRRRNLVRSFPYTTAAGLVFESGDYVGMLDLLEETIDWKRVRAENEELRGQGVHRGLGVAFAVEQSAYGPLSLASRQMEMTFGYDTASIRVEPDGHVRVAVGLHNHGQGHETTIAQLAASELGIDPNDIVVIWGDTATVPYGLGTWASRSTVTSGSATLLAARDIKDKVLRLAVGDARGRPRRPRHRGRARVRCAAPPRAACLPRRGPPGRARAAPAARGRGAGAGDHAPLHAARPGHVRQRRPRRPRRARPETGAVTHPALRGGRGLRHDGQPD